ncbi:MAG: fibronectin type III domain-containing protein [Verrucomicrobiota bacterium]
MEGLIPGTLYSIQVRGIGGSTGTSDWSDPVSHMAT